MKSYAFVLFLSLSCSHAPTGDSGVSHSAAQQISKTRDASNTQEIQNRDQSSASDCLPTSDIESNPKKQKSFALVRARCKIEIESFCKDVECPDLMKPTQVCLMMNDGEMSKECKKEVNRHIREYQPSVKQLDE